MLKVSFFSFICAVLLFTGCSEDSMELENTAPTVQFRFFNNSKSVKPDSLYAYGTTGFYIFEDSLSSYLIPLYVSDENDTLNSDYTFFIDSLHSDVSIYYKLKLKDNINSINYRAELFGAGATNLDSLIVYCPDTVNCNANEAIFNLYF